VAKERPKPCPPPRGPPTRPRSASEPGKRFPDLEWTRARPRQVELAPKMRSWERRRREDLCATYKAVRALRIMAEQALLHQGRWTFWTGTASMGDVADQLVWNRRPIKVQHLEAAIKYTTTGTKVWKPPILKWLDERGC